MVLIFMRSCPKILRRAERREKPPYCNTGVENTTDAPRRLEALGFRPFRTFFAVFCLPQSTNFV